MFKKLKMRILWTNLIILSVLIAVSFFTTYALSYQMIYRGIERDLNRIANMTGNHDANQGEQPPIMPNGGPQPDRMPIFGLETSKEGDILKVDAFFDAEIDFYREIISLIKITGSSDIGIISFEGNDWAYIYRAQNNLIRYSFIDVSPQMAVLDDLIMVFAGVFLGSIVLVIAISNYLTTNSTKPIKEAFDKQKQFISDASHELKTPIAIIGSTTDLILNESKASLASDPTFIKWLENIKQESDKMGRLTKDLLYLAQIDHEEGILATRQNYNFSESVEEIALNMEVLAFERSITFDYTVDPDVMLQGNREQLNEVVRILLDNAIKYTDANGHIHLKLKSHAPGCTLSVVNSGDGIDEQHIDHIFDRFYRVDSARSRAAQSHGLGLSIAKSIVEQHKGKISCSSTPGVATEFVIRL